MINAKRIIGNNNTVITIIFMKAILISCTHLFMTHAYIYSLPIHYCDINGALSVFRILSLLVYSL